MNQSATKTESCKRLKMLGASFFDIAGFCCGIIPMYVSPCGKRRRITPGELELVRQFEEKHNATVYAVLTAKWPVDEQLAFLFVEKANQNLWEDELRFMESELRVGAYVHVPTCPHFNEFCTIRYVVGKHGPIRVS